MDYLSILASKREGTGKKAMKSLRKEGSIPAVLYGSGTNTNLSVKPLAVRDLIYTSEFKLAELDLDGSKHKCFVKDIQFDPITDEIRHIDFLELIKGQPVKVNVPVNYVGESPGVKVGGSLMSQMRSIKIKCTPENIVSSLDLDISGVELGGAIRVRDLTVPANIEVLSVSAAPVAYVEVPRALKSAATAEAAEGEEDTAGEGE